jgi:HNH endonuclease
MSEKTVKIVWARAGGICSYPGCYKSLILSPESPGDPHAALGEMAHIVGHSEEGPRGEETFRGVDRDGPDNLLLLCTEHHTLIDQQRQGHSSARLYHIKEEHERWVRERLSPDQRFLQSHASHERVEDTLHSTLLPVTHIPLTVFTAPCTLTPQEVQERLVYPVSGSEPQIYLPFVRHGNRLLTFCDLKSKDGPFRYCIDACKRALLLQVGEVQREPLSVGTQGIACSANRIKIFEVANDRNNQVPTVINDNVAPLVILCDNFLDLHDE